MPHQITEEELDEICLDLGRLRNRRWKKLVSEVDSRRNQAFIWVLIGSREDLNAVAKSIFEVVPGYLEKMDGVLFFVTIFEKDDKSKIAWETFENADLMAGFNDKLIGSNPDIKPLTKYDVFGSNFL